MKHIVIIGAGGHGREVAEILHHQAQQGQGPPVLGFIDDNQQLHKQRINELPVLGDWTWFDRVDQTEIGVLCAVGSPNLCCTLTQKAEALNLSFANAVSPLAHISPTASIGRGVTIFPNVIINTAVTLQDYCIANVSATISHDTVVGRYSNLNPGVHLAGSVTIGEGCYIGMGANIIQGCSIGAWTTIGAGTVVIRNLPAKVTVVGVPAKIIKKIEDTL